MSELTSKEIVKIAVDAMLDKKAGDVKVLDISNISVIADYFIIADGSNTNQIQAIVDNIEEKLHEAGADEPRVEGYNTASWILLDYNDVIIHVFNRDDRLYYDLDRIWRDGKEITVETL
jgi:ribosome-associated protein